MAHFEDAELGVSFDIPDRFTVREQLAFRGRMSELVGESGFVRYWHAAQGVIQNWQSADVPDMAGLDLDAIDSSRIADVVAWTANTVAGHMNSLEAAPKN